MRCSVALFILLILATSLMGCGREFEPYWRIDKLRLMAIKADPIVAKQFEPVTLSALVFAPGEPEIRYHWSWCPVRVSAQDGYECPLGEDELQGVPLDFDLGTEETATFVNPFSDEEVREFCEAIATLLIEELGDPELAGLLPVSDCTRGYEISVRLEVETDEESIISTKRLVLWGGAEQFNENPVMADFQIRPQDPDDLSTLITNAQWELDESTPHDDQWISVDPEAEDLKILLTDITMEIRALVDPDSIQSFEVFSPSSPEGREEKEALVFRYFVTQGTLGGSRQLFAPRFQEQEEATITTFRVSANQFEEQCLEPVDGGCIARIFAIARDGRLGVDWTDRAFLVLPAVEQ